MSRMIKHQTDTIEQKIGIMDEPEQSCPSIDRLQHYRADIAKSIYNIPYYFNRDIPGDVQSLLEEAEFALRIMEDEIEELRTINRDIRMWGDEWKRIALSLIEKYYPDMLKK